MPALVMPSSSSGQFARVTTLSLGGLLVLSRGARYAAYMGMLTGQGEETTASGYSLKVCGSTSCLPR